MANLASFNLMQWIEDNRELLKPPMLNKPIWRDTDFTVIILAGPIVRNDFHVNPTEEFFYQLKGNMFVRVVEDGAIRDVPVDEGNIMLMPAACHIHRSDRNRAASGWWWNADGRKA